jgi:hypothetical protein
MQEKVAKREIAQIDKQIAAGRIRVAVAEAELALTKRQIEQARDVRRVMLTKFTKEDLYDWMAGEAAAVYYQAYKLAYDVARKAERAYQIERGDGGQTFVRFGYWDSLKKGLLAGEKLALDLRRLDAAYLESPRELELTKQVSLVKHDPLQFLTFRETGTCSFSITEKDYDKDFPTHYLRRLKQVSVTVPCAPGAYEGVLGTLSLLQGSTRIKPTDASVTSLFHNIQSICTSSAQSDAGAFELSFRDERRLPFEGTGAHSESAGQWSFALTPGNEMDYESISDLVLHVRYTARQGRAQPNGLFGAGSPRQRLIRLKHDFADAWHAYMEATATEVIVPMTKALFPKARVETHNQITAVEIYGKWSPNPGSHPSMDYALPGGSLDPATTAGALSGTTLKKYTTTGSWTFNDAAPNWKFKPAVPNLVDIWLVVTYSLT